jgi:pyruvate dehydrogenase E2 component (dihydrolipoamide acetyltransferase)
MPYEFKLPEAEAGEEVEEGIVVAWFKREGAQVKEGEPLLEVQFAKVSSEVVAPISGRLQRILAPRDAVIKAGQVLALILEPDEEAIIDEQALAATPRKEAAAGEIGRFIPASPAARRLAKEQGIDLAVVQGTGAEGRISEEDVERYIAAQRAAKAPREVRASPIAKRVAQEHGIDLATVTGTGPEGRITEQDVREAVQARKVEAPGQRVEALTPMRKTIARRMVESLQTAAQLTLLSEADVTELVALRERLKEEYDVSYTDLIVKAVALALVEHPRLNARLVRDELHLLPEINIGVAVALDAGLVVPVIRDAQAKDVAMIAGEAKALVERAREGKLTEQEMSGGTFTVTNLGAYGVDAFTPIINPPEVAILGVGRIREQLVRCGDGMAWRQKMGLSLTFDHQVVDGAPAAVFLQSICRQLEQPNALVG